jgi:hypothetical protein
LDFLLFENENVPSSPYMKTFPRVKLLWKKNEMCSGVIVIKGSRNHPAKQSLLFATENAPSMGINHGAYGRMKSSPTSIQSAKSSNARGMMGCHDVQ